MTPEKVYRCLGRLPLNKGEKTFAGVIPSSSLALLLKIANTDKLKHFIVLTACERRHGKSVGHYVVLSWFKKTFSLYDPLNIDFAIFDPYVNHFVNVSGCVVNYMSCQHIYSPHCSLYCICFIYLICQGFQDVKVVCILKSLRLPKALNKITSSKAFSKFLSLVLDKSY
jgi:hypothetical protein